MQKGANKTKFTYRVDNKLRGAFGQIDYDKKEIVVNKKKHRKGAPVRHLTKNKDGSENLLTTILHEENHRKHPKMKERGVEKLARAMKSHMSTKQKAQLYRKFQ